MGSAAEKPLMYLLWLRGWSMLAGPALVTEAQVQQDTARRRTLCPH